jgi:hypothetical protein
MGKFLTIILLVCTIVAGGALYYLQIYAFYDDVPGNGTDDVQLTALATGAPEPIAYSDFSAIDSDSSPIRYRACFATSLTPDALAATYAPYDKATPLIAPGWFGCFDAEEIGVALETGAARAFLGTENIQYGIDRIVAVTEDGRGYVWHQINRCGEIVFDGNPAPDDCPKPPEGY